MTSTPTNNALNFVKITSKAQVYLLSDRNILTHGRTDEVLCWHVNHNINCRHLHEVDLFSKVPISYVCEKEVNRHMTDTIIHSFSNHMLFKSTCCCLDRSRTYFGRMILSSSERYACWLKDENSRSVGGYLKGVAPKLKEHCWWDMKLAAAKNPFLRENKKTRWNN